MKIAILGFDRQGRSALEYWSQHDADITVHDKNPEVTIPAGVAHNLGDAYLEELDTYDVLVRTPGLHPRDIVDANPKSPDILDKVTTVTNEFLKVCPSANIIGVTGTKGKGTTSTLISNMLRAAGKRVHLGGNIGIAPLELLKNSIEADDWVVLELANYQLIDLQHSPSIAVCLMITPEHLDWHESFEDYLRAKQQLFVHQTEEDIAIYKSGDNRSAHLASSSLGVHIPYMEQPGAHIKDSSVWIDGQKICPVSDVQLPGKHNLENICAAVTAVWQAAPNPGAIREAVQNTAALPFRIEERRTVNGVSYVNDSFATNPGATIAAIHAIDQPKVLLLGGYDRGLDFFELASCVADKNNSVKHAVLYGATKQRIADALTQTGYTDITLLDPAENLAEVVKAAKDVADEGDAVVLSPACASFDMFQNFEVRGQAFNEVVEGL